jgi:hypothetical protein
VLTRRGSHQLPLDYSVQSKWLVLSRLPWGKHLYIDWLSFGTRRRHVLNKLVGIWRSFCQSLNPLRRAEYRGSTLLKLDHQSSSSQLSIKFMDNAKFATRHIAIGCKITHSGRVGLFLSPHTSKAFILHKLLGKPRRCKTLDWETSDKVCPMKWKRLGCCKPSPLQGFPVVSGERRRLVSNTEPRSGLLTVGF